MTLREFGMGALGRDWPATLGDVPGVSPLVARQALLRALWVVALVGAVITFITEYAVVAYRWSVAGYGAWDARHYMDAAHRFVDTGTPYLSAEVAGPFTYGDLTFLHPPISLYLFVPFAYLPAPIWWIVPVAGTVALIASMRPARWSWPILIALLCWPTMAIATVVGNTDLWMLFAVSAGLRFGWPALAIVAKPSMFPLAFAGVRHRSWWVGAAVLVVLAVPFGSLWLDWVAVIVHSPGSLTYSLSSMVPLLMPFMAWSARRSPRP